jgi:hypothetical protein
VIPIILGAIALSTGAFGANKVIKGVGDISVAKKKVARAVKLYNQGNAKLESRASQVNKIAEEYGVLQMSIKETVFARTVSLIEAIGRKSKVDIYEVIAGIDAKAPQVKVGEHHNIAAVDALKGLVSAAGMSAVASAATTSGVTAFATASTGAAISGLSGAAANSAMLAALGGGSLAAGGGGMALGTVVLSGIAAGPAIAIGGLAIAAEGEKALTKAVEAEVQVKHALALMRVKDTLLNAISSRISELSSIINEMQRLATHVLDDLERLVERDIFNVSSDDHMEKLRSLLLVVGSLASIMRTPILDEDGELNPEIDVVIKKVRP